MADIDNVVPDDQPVSEKPAAVVILEETEKPAAEAKPVEIKEELKKPEGQVIEGDAAQEGVAALTQHLEKTKKIAEKATQTATVAEGKVTALENEVAAARTTLTAAQRQNVEHNFSAATTAKANGEAAVTQYKREAAALQAEGKFEEAEDARMKASDARQEVKNAEAYLSRYFPEGIEPVIKTMEETAAKPMGPVSDASGTVDPVTGMKFTPRTFAYIQAQGDDWKDQDFRVACDAAQRASKKKGIKPDTDEWVDFMNYQLVLMGFKDAAEPQPESEGEEMETTPAPKPEAKPAQRRAAGGASASPPPSRAVQGTNGVPQKGVKLSGQERDVAEAIFKSLPDVFPNANPDVEYAKQKKALIAEQGENYGRNNG